jgi:hypothetical protein
MCLDSLSRLVCIPSILAPSQYHLVFFCGSTIIPLCRQRPCTCASSWLLGCPQGQVLWLTQHLDIWLCWRPTAAGRLHKGSMQCRYEVHSAQRVQAHCSRLPWHECTLMLLSPCLFCHACMQRLIELGMHFAKLPQAGPSESLFAPLFEPEGKAAPHAPVLQPRRSIPAAVGM